MIKTFFSPLSRENDFVRLGQGDDCALIASRAGHECAISTDTLVSGVHFLPTLNAEALGYRCLAVNLSDLAAMGARPRAYTLSLSLPEINPQWLAAFSNGLRHGAAPYDCVLMGGDLTKGPVVSVTITVFGEVALGQALRRDGMRLGDQLWLSGSIGGAWCGLQLALGTLAVEAPWLRLSDTQSDEARRCFERPQARVALGQSLVGIATAALDVSDGLAGDAQHLCRASGLGLVVELDCLPIFSALRSHSDRFAAGLEVALTGGDDYELLFTAPAACSPQIHDIAEDLGVPLSRVGRVTANTNQGLVHYVSDQPHVQAEITERVRNGFEHF